MARRSLLWATYVVLVCPGLVTAQTTAGSGTTVVFPVTAQTGSFASEVTLFNPGPNLLNASVAFYEANDSGTPGPKTCNDVSVSANRSVQFQIGTQCALGAGSHFGLLVVADKAVPTTNYFYGYTRVQNPQGIGFSIEGFPAQNFNNQVSNATGLKKQAAAPTYQTNCFVGSLDQAVTYELRLFNDATGMQVGGTLTGSLAPFQQYRYLDVFGASGANAPGDHSNVRAQFTQTSGGTANLIGFCTVQDNTSFGADFRIAKSYGVPGTLTSLAQGAGIVLTPNPINSTGTIAADPNYLQRRVSSSCAAGSSIRAIATDGTVTCQSAASSGGTVTSVATGTGLSGGPITTSGTISADTTYLQRRVSSSCAAGSSIRAIAADGTVTCQTDNTGPANAFVQGGNAFGTTAKLGTLDNNPLELYVSNARGLRIEPNPTSPNWFAGYAGNAAYLGTVGVTVAGGGGPGAQGVYLSGHLCGQAFGCINGILDSYGTIGGGAGNLAGAGTSGVDGAFATVGGGINNWAYADLSTVGGGYTNTASGEASTVGGGWSNTASGSASMVPGGTNNTAAGMRSLAAGNGAQAMQDGMFVWSDFAATTFDPSVSPPGWAAPSNTFNVRATGGVWFVTGVNGTGTPTWGCTLINGSGWFCSSDRNLKRNLVLLDGKAVLDKLAAMPVYRWQPKDGPHANDIHYGPTAQDFHAAFALGHTDTAIGFQDADGVALAAIQGLHQLMQEKDAKIEAQQREINDQHHAIDELRDEVGALKRAVARLAGANASVALQQAR
jgi:hypothetical protein